MRLNPALLMLFLVLPTVLGLLHLPQAAAYSVVEHGMYKTVSDDGVPSDPTRTFTRSDRAFLFFLISVSASDLPLKIDYKVIAPSGASAGERGWPALNDTGTWRLWTGYTLTNEARQGLWTFEVYERKNLLFREYFGLEHYFVSVTVFGLPAGQTTILRADGKDVGKMASDDFRPMSFPIGSAHVVEVDESLAATADKRLHVGEFSQTVTKETELVFRYSTQYLLTVDVDPAGVVEGIAGQEWADEGSVFTPKNPLPKIANGTVGTRFTFVGWVVDGKPPAATFRVIGPHKVVAKYKTQYLLTVKSEYGSAKGTGWYDAGSKAAVFIDIAEAQPSGIWDALGFIFVFDRWTAGAEPAETRTTVVIDKPMTVTAQWRPQPTIRGYLTIVAIVAVIAGVIVAFRKFDLKTAFARRPRKPPVVTSVTTTSSPAPASVPRPAPQTTARAPVAPTPVPAQMMYCRECGAQVSRDVVFCSLCGTKLK